MVFCSPSSYVSVITCPHIAQYREPYSYTVSYNLGCIWCLLLAEYVPTFQTIILDRSGSLLSLTTKSVETLHLMGPLFVCFKFKYEKINKAIIGPL